jgi:hypothetical protein
MGNIGKPMCWVKDFYNEETDQWYAEYFCKKWKDGEGYIIVKLKASRAPDCFGLCEEGHV